MKNLKRGLIVGLFLIWFLPVKADHIAGGEVSWVCVRSGSDFGKYIFTLKVYRNCQGIPLGSSTAISSNSPAGSINLVRTAIRSLEPSCHLGNPISCSNAVTSLYVVDEHTFQSAPITITGTPPVTGWSFYWNNCCRPDPAIYSWGTIIDNLSPQNQSFRILATLYPTSNMVASVCYDSSPKFAESPSIDFCNGVSYNFFQTAFDEDLDSLVYSFAKPLTASGNPVTFATDLNTSQTVPRAHGGNFIVPAPGFSETVPLPWSHVNMDTLNQPATINPNTGEVKFLSHTLGAYAMGIQVEAYRHGQKIASILRDTPWLILNCPALPLSSGPNTAPKIVFNSPTKGSGLGILYDTVRIGETVTFDVIASDSEMNAVGQAQIISLTAVSNQFGAGFSDPFSGCLRAECATLDTNLVSWTGSLWRDSIQVGTSFSWNTSCIHLLQSDSLSSKSKTYTFLFKAQDDYCDVPGTSFGIASITVVSDPSKSIALDSLQRLDINNTALYWQPYTGSGFNKYFFYRSLIPSMPYQLVDSLSSMSTSFYLDNDLKANLPYYYYVSLENANLADCITGKSAGTIVHKTNKSSLGKASINWNPILYGDTTPVNYRIYRTDTLLQFVLLDSVIDKINYADSLLPCVDTLSYYVDAVINGQHFTHSIADTIYPVNMTNYANQLVSASADSAGNVSLKWSKATIGANFKAYFIYVATDSLGPYHKIDSIYSLNIVNAIHHNSGADTMDVFYYVRVLGYSDCLRSYGLSMQSNILKISAGVVTNPNIGVIQLSPNENRRNYSVHPNPNSGNFEISLEMSADEEIGMEMFDLTGKRVFIRSDQASVNGRNSFSMDIHELPKGLYLFKIKLGTEVFMSKVLYQ